RLGEAQPDAEPRPRPAGINLGSCLPARAAGRLLLRPRLRPRTSRNDGVAEEQQARLVGAGQLARCDQQQQRPRRTERRGPRRAPARQEPRRRLVAPDRLLPRPAPRRLPAQPHRAPDHGRLPREALLTLPLTVAPADASQARPPGPPRRTSP